MIRSAEEMAAYCGKLEALLHDTPVLIVNRAAARKADDKAALEYADEIYRWKLRYDALRGAA